MLASTAMGAVWSQAGCSPPESQGLLRLGVHPLWMSAAELGGPQVHGAIGDALSANPCQASRDQENHCAFFFFFCFFPPF